jgi:hypothetical protein
VKVVPASMPYASAAFLVVEKSSGRSCLSGGDPCNFIKLQP